MLTEEQVQRFYDDGVLVIPSFYDFEKEIQPIQFEIWRVIGLMIKKYNLPIKQKDFSPENFDSGYIEIITFNRKIGGEIYDTIKQLPSFLRLVTNSKNESIFKSIRKTDMVGIGRGSYGIRIDNPNEERYRAPWHQDFLAQFGSMDGIVFWSPLVEIKEDMGPVHFCLGSHKDGVVPVYTRDNEHPEKTGAYALRMREEKKIVSKYKIVSPLTKPSDLILIDFLTIHSSGFNTSFKSRWSMQFRYFNFLHPSGYELGWRAGYGAGVTLRDILPKYVLD